MDNKINIAVVGATGEVGKTMLTILAERKFPAENIHALASDESAGDVVTCGDHELVVQALSDFDFSQVDIALFSAGSEISKQYAPIAADHNCVVIDNTSAFRLDDDVPLIIPEINEERLIDFRKRNIIANPNCSTIQMLVALNPIHASVGIEAIHVSTYQAVSGAGRAAISKLAYETTQLIAGQADEDSVDISSEQIAFNVLPCIGELTDSGFSQEEMKMIQETHKIWQDDSIQVSATCVRVPVFFGHAEAIHVQTSDPMTVEEATTLLKDAPGVQLLPADEWPTPISHGVGTDDVAVGRLRNDLNNLHGFNCWTVSDNVRKGAALNAIQIAECLIRDHF